MSDTSLIIHGVPFSQPVRAVIWLLLMKEQPFKLNMINPGSKGASGSRSTEFLAKNPGGTIPTLEETDTGFTLGEANAIMTYLSRKHGWTDVYPQDNQTRAQVEWYLHYHHRNVRDASTGLVAPMVRKDLNIPELMQQSALRNLQNALKTLENGQLSKHRYIVGDNVTLADLAAYVEIGQLKPEFTNLFDFSDYPLIQRWLNDMAAVKGHDASHVVMKEMGDISREAPTMERIINANKLAMAALKN